MAVSIQYAKVSDFLPDHKIRAGDIFWYRFQDDDILPVEVLGIKETEKRGWVAEICGLISGASCRYVTFDQLLVKRILK
jgi:hypothetical protein